jgi:hypothetical protein
LIDIPRHLDVDVDVDLLLIWLFNDAHNSVSWWLINMEQLVWWELAGEA